MLLYNAKSNCLIAPPPLLSYLFLLNKLNKLKVYLEREIEREERKVDLAKGLHLVKKSISSIKRGRGAAPPACQKSKVRLRLLT